MRHHLPALLCLVSLFACANKEGQTSAADSTATASPRQRSEKEWKARLTPEQFHILREGGTERAFQGAYWQEHRPGVYHCAGCGAPLFSSSTKFESGTGWPSFWQPISPEVIEEREDHSWFSTRTEVRCQHCGSHLGHVFADGPPPTGLRYCLNSAALQLHLEPEQE